MSAAVGLALALDAAVAEPPDRLHPVAWFGRAVAVFERGWTRPRFAGAAGALALPALAAGAVGGAVALSGRTHPVVAVAAAALSLFSSTSLRALLATAAEVSAAAGTDPGRARERLRALAGRDASDLSAGRVRSAAVESAAENLADGLVAPLLAFAVGAQASLALAAGAAAWVKAVNTMDSMLGYRTDPVGWGPARLDDLVMWTPARISALLLAAAALAPGTPLRARAWVGDVSSPNSGWPMGTLAAALGVRLEKPGAYTLNPDADLPTATDARRGVRIVAVAGLLAYAGALLATAGGGLA